MPLIKHPITLPPHQTKQTQRQRQGIIKHAVPVKFTPDTTTSVTFEVPCIFQGQDITTQFQQMNQNVVDATNLINQNLNATSSSFGYTIAPRYTVAYITTIQDYQIKTTDYMVVVSNASSRETPSVFLPPAADLPTGTVFVIKNSGSSLGNIQLRWDYDHFIANGTTSPVTFGPGQSWTILNVASGLWEIIANQL